LFLGLTLWGQNAPSGPAFEVATIKPAPQITAAMAAAGQLHVGMKVDSARVDIGYTSLAELIRYAFEVKLHQISGPEWMSDQRWDVLAKIPDGAPASQVPQMLQALLAERFGMKVHRESKEMRVYGLEVAKGGPKLKESPPEQAPDPGGVRSEDKPLQVVASRDNMSSVTSGAGHGITKTEMRADGSMHLESSKMTLAMLCEALSFYLDRPVVDLTQLTGNYVVELEFSGADIRFAYAKAGAAAYGPAATDGASEPVGASLITSVQKLGLKLEAQQAPIETIVVDHLERNPREN
jgi:uncharacterized protein (TIGR03435 family)